MPFLSYTPLVDPPEPVAAYEADIPVGVLPFEVTSFKASLIREGSAKLEGNFDPFTVAAGDLVLMRPGTRCGSMSLSPVDTAVVQVHPAFLVDQVRWTRPLAQRSRRKTFESLLRNTRHPISIHLSDNNFLRIAELYAQIVWLSSRPDALRPMLARTTELIWEIEEQLASASRKTKWERTSMQDPPVSRDEVRDVIQAMHEGFASGVMIRDLAREVSLSDSALRRAFLADTGLTPREYLHRIRLVKFEELVADTATPLADAARSVGWSSASHARSAFAKSHGMSPSEFRAEAQEARRTDWLRGFED